MRKFIEKRVRYYDDGDCSEMWLAGFHDPTEPVTVDAVDPVFIATREKTNFDRMHEMESKTFAALMVDGANEGQFSPRDIRKFAEVTETALDKEEDRLLKDMHPEPKEKT